VKVAAGWRAGVRSLALLVVLLLLSSGCLSVGSALRGGDGSDDAPPAGGGAADSGDAAAGAAAGGGDAAAGTAAGDGDAAGRLSGELVVFAAASLTDVFEVLAAELEAAHPGLRVLLNLAGSQQLAGQVLEGAPADVLATAAPEPIGRVAAAGLLEAPPTVFATNRLEIAVEPGNPEGVRDLADLARDGLVVVLAAPEVPAGRYAAEALAAAGVEVSPDSLEVDVRAVLGKVRLGEADAGIVYRSDVLAADGAVEGVPLPEAAGVVARYPAAVLADAPNPQAARAFLDLLLSGAGRAVLDAHGFGPP
jgi:molybdate transport system substrate-binding protein